MTTWEKVFQLYLKRLLNLQIWTSQFLPQTAQTAKISSVIKPGNSWPNSFPKYLPLQSSIREKSERKLKRKNSTENKEMTSKFCWKVIFSILNSLLHVDKSP